MSYLRQYTVILQFITRSLAYQAPQLGEVLTQNINI